MPLRTLSVYRNSNSEVFYKLISDEVKIQTPQFSLKNSGYESYSTGVNFNKGFLQMTGSVFSTTLRCLNMLFYFRLWQLITHGISIYQYLVL